MSFVDLELNVFACVLNCVAALSLREAAQRSIPRSLAPDHTTHKRPSTLPPQ